jgi:hypothetical protein
VLGVALHTEDESKMVVYQALYHAEDLGPHPYFVRPAEMFLETVNRDGYSGPRFTKLQEGGPYICKDCGASL